MLTRFGCLWVLCLAGSAYAADSPGSDPLDWPYWRGPEMNGVSREKNLPASWSLEGENLLWKNEELGTRSTPIVMRGKLYTLCRHKPATLEEAEKVVCADAETGEIEWEHVFNVYLTDVPDTRVGWSSVVGDPDTGNVFALGVCGYFACLNGETGEPLWKHSMSEEYGMLSTYGGRTNFPIVHENLVIISGVVIGWGDMARPAHRILAFDKRNGQCVWFQSTRPLPEDTTYSSPVLTVIQGQAQFIIGAGDGGVYGFQPRTGKIIWNYDVSPRGINSPPVVTGNLVLCGHSEENLDSTAMGALFAVDASKSGDLTKSGEVWRIKEEGIGKTQPVVVGDRVYAIDDSANFFVNDLKTGKTIGRQKLGTMGRGSPLYADGKFYCTDATGRWYIFEPNEAKGLRRIHKLELEAEINASPIVSHGKIYLATDTAMFCIGLKGAKPLADAIPAPESETPLSDDTTPAQAILAPVESLLKPGYKQGLQVFLYNANGQFLRTAKPDDVKFSVAGSGTVDESGKYIAPVDHEHRSAIVTAVSNGLKAQARIRVIPDLPWGFTFDDAVVPVTGVGMRYRHIGIDFDFYQKLKAADVLSSRVYIFLTTQFTNVPAPVAKFDDTTPAQTWTVFRRYLGLLETITTQEAAQEKLDPILKTLQQEEVIGDFKWTGNEKIGTQLTVTKGQRKVAGNGVICKITTIPKGTRSQGWIGSPDSKHYEIQADVFAVGNQAEEGDRNAKLPDIGLICQRYRFDMMGAAQQLKLYSWIPHDQKYFQKPFAWVPETWYTLKFRVTVEERDGTPIAVLRGKSWQRDAAEPQDWSIEWTDSPANLNGSPGLFGNASSAEIFIDNVKITPLEGVQ